MQAIDEKQKILSAKKAEYFGMIATGKPVQFRIKDRNWSDVEPMWDYPSTDKYEFRFKPEDKPDVTLTLTYEELVMLRAITGSISWVRSNEDYYIRHKARVLGCDIEALGNDEKAEKIYYALYIKAYELLNQIEKLGN